MRIGVDMHFAQGRLATAGIGIYSFDHIAHLQEKPDVEVIPFQPIFEGMSRSQYARELSNFIVENKIDIFHLPSPMSVPFPDVIGSAEMPDVRLTATIYDLIPLIYPQIYLPNDVHKARYHLHLQMLHRMHRMFAISEFTRQDFMRAGFPGEKITTIGTGGSEFFFQLPEASLGDFAGVFPTDRPFVLAFSPRDFRKNVRRIVQAFAMATSGQSKEYHLVIVGESTGEIQREMNDLAATHGRPGAVHFAGHVSKSQLLRLYNQADAVALPSLYEGWGLPVLESLQCGTPVLTSNSTSLPEAAGEAAVYADPNDVNSIADGFRHLLFAPGVRESLASIAPVVAARHRWVDVSEKTATVFAELMASVQLTPWRAHNVNYSGQVTLRPNRYQLVRPGGIRGKGRKVGKGNGSRTGGRNGGRPAVTNARRGRATGGKGKQGPGLPLTYVSFNLQEVPADATIIRAVLHFPMRRGAKKPLVRAINRGWSVASVTKRRPLTRRLKFGGRGRLTRRGKGVAGEAVFHWPCTVLARRWRSKPLRNHGVMVRRAMKRLPVLTVTYAHRTTVYR